MKTQLMNEDLEKILKQIRHLFFDIDGTIFSSVEMLEEVYQEAMKEYFREANIERKLPSFDEIILHIGLPVKQIFANLLPDIDEVGREKISQKILEIFVKRIQNGEGLHYPNVKETIEYLYKKQYNLFAASNGRKPYVEAILKANQTYPYFKEIPTLDYQKIHDKTQLVAYIIQKYQLEPKQCVIIGDRDSDRKAAFENGIYFIAADYGHGDQKEREGAILHLQSFEDIKKYL
ncbi:MAG: HAD family hydrolase [Leptospiraceae bacterium]|nr:HAD family hydrolase [Leptospiraceae bacterium]MDW7976902.1 HAD family hydrolase [Leptospiraceae bacterium]